MTKAPDRLRALTAGAILSLSGWLAGAAPAEAQTRAPVNPILIENLVTAGKPQEAIAEATAALDRLRAGSEPASPGLIGRLLIILCEAHNDLEEYDRAERACLEAVATLEPAAASDPSALWLLKEMALAQLALTYEASVQLEKALDTHRRELALTGPDDAAWRVHLLSRIGELEQSQGRWRAAEAAFAAALADIDAVPRSDRELTYLTYARFAQLHRLEERFDKAEDLLEQGLAALRDDFGEGSPYLPVLAEVLAWTYYEQGQVETAQHRAKTIIDHYEQRGKADSLLTVNVRLLLARTQEDLSPGLPEAERSLALALATSQGTDGTGALLHAMARRELARHYLATRNFVEAEPMAAGAAASLVQLYGRATVHSAQADLLRARALEGQRKTAEALAVAQQAYDAQRRLLPPYHSEIGETLTLLSALYAALGQDENRKATDALIAGYETERAKFEAAR